MRYEATSPALLVVDLLARADALAGAIASAISRADDVALSGLLDERGDVIAAVEQASRSLDLDASVQTAVSEALATSQDIAERVQQLAAITRDQIAAELASLDARRQATHEYLSDRSTGSFSIIA
jgi:hypothetical protein